MNLKLLEYNKLNNLCIFNNLKLEYKSGLIFKMENRFNFEVVDLNRIDREVFNNFPHKSVNTTKEWIEFIAEDSNAEPYILKITEKGCLVGFFSLMLSVNQTFAAVSGYAHRKAWAFLSV